MRQITSVRASRPTNQMPCFAPIRFAAAAAGIAFAASLPAQSPPAQSPRSRQTNVAAQPPQNTSTLPATTPTAPVQPEIPLTPQQRPAQRAQITYADGALSITADNSSLNQILRQISSDTGIKITGGVADERVFGKYGPADPAQVLAELLGGTGSNMILVHRESEAHAELILTPRQGGPTPPNPNSHAFDNRREEPEPPPPTRVEQVAPPPAPPLVNSPGNYPGNAATPPTTPPSQPESPNGVKTPQQIYEQLQRLRNQQTQPTQPQ
jgi:hypothetical protein